MFAHRGQYRRLSSGSSCKTYTLQTGPKRFSQEVTLTHTRTGKVSAPGHAGQQYSSHHTLGAYGCSQASSKYQGH